MKEERLAYQREARRMTVTDDVSKWLVLQEEKQKEKQEIKGDGRT